MDRDEFIKKERNAFIWVNVGCVLLFIGLMIWKYAPFVQLLDTRCGFHEFLHLYCPGCGGTRAVYALLRLDIIESFLYHPIVPMLALLLVEYYIGAIVTLIRKNGKRYYYLRIWFCYVALGVIIVHFILRNVLLVFCHYDYIGDLLSYWLNISLNSYCNFMLYF